MFAQSFHWPPVKCSPFMSTSQPKGFVITWRIAGPWKRGLYIKQFVSYCMQWSHAVFNGNQLAYILMGLCSHQKDHAPRRLFCEVTRGGPETCRWRQGIAEAACPSSSWSRHRLAATRDSRGMTHSLKPLSGQLSICRLLTAETLWWCFVPIARNKSVQLLLSFCISPPAHTSMVPCRSWGKALWSIGSQGIYISMWPLFVFPTL